MLGDSRLSEGDWLVALAQDSGRGRQGRDWVSAAGNFFGSTIVDLAPGEPPPQSLSLVAGLAVAEAVEVVAPGRELMLKWPNDLLLDGAKLAGILLERQDRRVIAGIGINLAASPAVERRSVANLGGVMTPQAFAPILAATMAQALSRWRSASPREFAQAWLERAHPPGTELHVHCEAAKPIRGRFDGIEPDGTLRLLRADGSIEMVRAADVSLA